MSNKSTLPVRRTGPPSLPEVMDRMEPEAAAEARAAYRRFCKEFGVGRVTTPEPTEAEGHRADLGVVEVVRRTLNEGLFEVRPDELEAIRGVFADTKKIHEEIAYHSQDEVTRRFKSSTPTPDRVPLDQQQERSRKYKSYLKQKVAARIAEFAPVASEIIRRARQTVDGHLEILEAHERSRAHCYGARFVESHTLSVLKSAANYLREVEKTTQNLPDCVDIGTFARLVAPFAG